ncbi:MAG: hypothetical protein H7145_19570 [Akkermansiaceae bacterium]|nr:hypothetical protein [Armatimonadota bacterium]
MSTGIMECVIAPKRGDFVQGRVHCLVGLAAYVSQDRRDGIETDICGIVVDRQVWQFYRRETSAAVSGSVLYTVSVLPDLVSA